MEPAVISAPNGGSQQPLGLALSFYLFETPDEAAEWFLSSQQPLGLALSFYIPHQLFETPDEAAGLNSRLGLH